MGFSAAAVCALGGDRLPGAGRHLPWFATPPGTSQGDALTDETRVLLYARRGEVGVRSRRSSREEILLSSRDLGATAICQTDLSAVLAHCAPYRCCGKSASRRARRRDSSASQPVNEAGGFSLRWRPLDGAVPDMAGAGAHRLSGASPFLRGRDGTDPQLSRLSRLWRRPASAP